MDLDNPWGVLRMEMDNTKVYGDTYWGFQVNGNDLYFASGTSFMLYNDNSTYDKGHYYGNSLGVKYIRNCILTLKVQIIDILTALLTAKMNRFIWNLQVQVVMCWN